MSNTLNRAGIALNFVAGFLLAPHLIGEHRLERAASYVSAWLHARLPGMAAQMFKAEQVAKRNRDLLEALAEHRGVPVAVLEEEQAAVRKREKRKDSVSPWYIAASIRPNREPNKIVMFVAVALVFPIFGALLVLGLVLSIPGSLVQATRNRRWLITAMTSMGITAFTIGTALQFWATYED